MRTRGQKGDGAMVGPSRRAISVIAGTALALSLTGCFSDAPEAGGSDPVALPQGFPSSIPVDPAAIRDAGVEPGGIWSVELASTDEGQEKFLDDLIESGFVVSGSSDSDAERVVSLASAEYSMRVAFVDEDDGSRTIQISVAPNGGGR